MTTGEALGTLRKTLNLAGYSISKAPTTVGQYQQCVAAGACTPPSVASGPCASNANLDGPTYPAASAAPQRPVTCVSSQDATKYCSWVGGRLPRVSEWLLAARGQSPQRYAWGAVPANCQQRPNLRHYTNECCGTGCDSADAGAVLQHPAGDSPLGLSDVLMTPSEIVTGEPDVSEPACQTAGAACLVTGTQAGAIDTFQREPEQYDASNMPAALVTSFRCVWEGAKQ